MNNKNSAEASIGTRMLLAIDLVKKIRRLHTLREKDPVPEELRGWFHYSPPIKPRAYLGLGVSEIANRYCETRRDIYLRRVARVRISTRPAPLQNGAAIHRVFRVASEKTREIIFSRDIIERLETELRRSSSTLSNICGREILGLCTDLYKKLLVTWVSEIIKSRSIYGGDLVATLPWLSEIRVDGSLIGLSDRLSVDAIVNPLVVAEIKTGAEREFHRLSLAGYALAIESNLEIPVDYGVLIYVSNSPGSGVEIRYDVHYISPDLRREFIDARDEVIDMILSGRDPGKSRECPDTCPFKEVCG